MSVGRDKCETPQKKIRPDVKGQKEALKPTRTPRRKL
jgi:hypothetical protein